MQSSQYKKVLIFLLKLLISVGLISWVLITQFNFSEFKYVAAIIDIRLLLFAFSTKFIGIFISAMRWKKLLAFMNIKVKSTSLVKSYMIGLFFNLFLPTRIGGDIVRVTDLRKASESLNKSASIVFVERFLGISVLFFFAFCASLYKLPLAREIPSIWVGLTMGLLGLSAIIFFLKFDLFDNILRLIPLKKLRMRIMGSWSSFKDNVLVLLSDRNPLGWGIFYSFLLQLNVIFQYWLLGEAFDFDVPMMDYFFLIPIQLVILMLPSINGIGLREVSNIMLFASYGITATHAVSFGFAEFFLSIIMGFLGGLLFVLRKSTPEAVDRKIIK